MKTEELNALKEKVESKNKKLAELTEDELTRVSGGIHGGGGDGAGGEGGGPGVHIAPEHTFPGVNGTGTQPIDNGSPLIVVGE